MKKILLLISLFACIAASAQLPSIPGTQPRSLPANRPQDYNLWVRNQLGLPIFNDTTQANTNTNLDTCGRVIYTYDVDNFWIRKCFPVKHWEVVGGGFVTVSTCGLQNGTGVVTYDDSTLNFDISPAIYALCCDHVPRTTVFAHITLDSNTADNPRKDAIVLTDTGIAVIKGVPNANPSQPQLTDCQILLTYVDINAHENIPANFSVNPIIYDEAIIPPEWDTLATAVSANFSDQFSPVHLTHDISVGSVTGGTSSLTLTRIDSSVNLADYGVLKFYIKLKGGYPGAGNNRTVMDFTWYLDDTPVSNPLPFTIGQFGFQNVAGVYFGVSIPIDAWQYTSLTANRLMIRFLRTNTSGMYFDWIQLQTGLLASGTFVRSFSADGNILFSTIVINPNSTPVLKMPLSNQPPFTIFLQDTSFSHPPHFGKLDLSLDNYFLNTLSVTRLTPGPDGTYLGSQGGTAQWLPKIVDTTVTHNGVYREVNGINSTDSLSYGYWKRDSAALVYDNTYLGMNGKTFSYQQGATDFWKIASNGFNAFVTQSGSRFEWTTGINVTAANDLTLGNDGNVFTVTGNTQINALTTANWQSGSNVQLIFSGTPTVKNNTAGGAGTATILLAGSVDFTAAANDVLSLVYDGFNWHESSRKTSAGPAPGQQTLQQTFNTEVGGSAFTKNDSTLQANFSLNFLNNSASESTLNLKNSSSAYVETVTGTNGINVSTTDNGVVSSTVNRSAITGLTTATNPADFIINASGTNTVLQNLDLQRLTTGTPAAGIGESIDYTIQTTTTSRVVNQIISKLTDATDATRTSQLDITGVGTATTRTIMSAHGSGVVGVGISTGYTATRLEVVDNAMAFAPMVRLSSSTSSGGNLLQLVATDAADGIFVTVSNNQYGIWSIAVDNSAIIGQSTNGFAISGESTNSYSLRGVSGAGASYAGLLAKTGGTNTATPVLQLSGVSNGTAANGFGVGMDFYASTVSIGSRLSNQVVSTWTDATDATRTSQLDITGVNSATTQTIVSMEGIGRTTFFSQNASYTLKGSTTSNVGVYGGSTTGIGVYGEASAAGIGVYGTVLVGGGTAVQGIAASSSTGVYGQSTETGIPLEGRLSTSSTNSVANGLRVRAVSSGTAANGFGVSQDFFLQTSTSNTLSNQLISKWIDATNATRTSQLIITGVNSAATGNILVISGDGSTQMPKYGAGAATFDASGNITSVSDVRLKDVQGYYNGGLNELMNVNPIIYKWNEKSGMERDHNYIGFSAQNIQSALGGDAIGINRDGFLSIQDRAILATLVNAIKEQQKEIDYLKSLINK